MITELWILGVLNLKERSYYWTDTPELTSNGEESGYQTSIMPIQSVGTKRLFVLDTLHRINDPGIYRLVKDLAPAENSKPKHFFQ